MQFITGVTAPIYRYHPAIMYIVPAQMKWNLFENLEKKIVPYFQGWTK
jgi:hypothetical protein